MEAVCTGGDAIMKKITIEIDDDLHHHIRAIGSVLYGTPKEAIIGLLRTAIEDWHRSPNLSSAAAQHLPPRLREVWTAINQRRTEKP